MARVPLYRQMEIYLREIVANAEVGDLLPTVYELTERFNSNGVQTVRDAYQPLIDEGLVDVHMRPRRRWFVASRPSESVADADATIVDELADLEADLKTILGRITELKRRYSEPRSEGEQA